MRVAIAGLGRSGWDIHARLLAEQPERFTVVAVQDHLAERRAEAEQRFGCRSYIKFDDLLADGEVELVVIAVPSHLHAPYAVAALQAVCCGALRWWRCPPRQATAKPRDSR